jgi:CrcB protein
MRYIWVGAAGAIGSVIRYTIGLHVDQARFPWATLAINLSGSFLLALFLTLALGRLSPAVMTPIAVGLIGGYTTYSTFAFEGFVMTREGRMLTALVYVSVSVLGGLCAASFGYTLARAFR